jgi:hypothetical protein
VEDVKHAIFRLDNFLEGRGREDEKGLELAQVQQAHQGIDVGRVKEYAPDWGAGGFALRRSELGRGQDLGAQVRRSSEKEPDNPVGRKSQLSLGTGRRAERACAKTGAVATGTVPLWEAATRGGA